MDAKVRGTTKLRWIAPHLPVIILFYSNPLKTPNLLTKSPEMPLYTGVLRG